MEVMVVLAIMGMVSLLSIVALKSVNTNEDVRAVTTELVSNFRSLQNKAINGSSGANYTYFKYNSLGTSYSVNGTNITFKQSVDLSFSGSSPLSVCFVHPSMIAIPGSPNCPCPGPVCFNTSLATSPLDIQISSGGVSRHVILEFDSLFVSRIYETP